MIVMAIVAVVAISIGMAALNYSYLEPIQTFAHHRIILICIQLFIENICVFIVCMQFGGGCAYLYDRFRFVNLLMRQLLPHQSLPDDYVIIGDRGRSYLRDFHYMSRPRVANNRAAKKRHPYRAVNHGHGSLGHRLPRAYHTGNINVISQANVGRLSRSDAERFVSNLTLHDAGMMRRM